MNSVIGSKNVISINILEKKNCRENWENVSEKNYFLPFLILGW